MANIGSQQSRRTLYGAASSSVESYCLGYANGMFVAVSSDSVKIAGTSDAVDPPEWRKAMRAHICVDTD